MNWMDYAINLVLTVILIFGVYQFYFYCQRHPIRAAKEWDSALDNRIPFRPHWVWIYSFLYYPAILYINFVVSSSRHFIYLAFNFIILLLLQMVFFLLFPVKTPEAWRDINRGQSKAERFLMLVQKFDGTSNAFPSMHVSVAMLCALHAFPVMGHWAWLFPSLIAISCLFTKQHYVRDLPAGALLGWGVFHIHQAIYT